MRTNPLSRSCGTSPLTGRFNFKFGFTLIELMIAIAIGLLVVGSGSIAMNNFNDRQKIETTRQELLADLRLARNYAITNQLPNDSTPDTDRVFVDINTSGLITVGTQTSGNIGTGYTFFSKNITNNDILITSNKLIKFSVTDGRSINGAINIGVSGVTVKNIRIDESGLIYEE